MNTLRFRRLQLSNAQHIHEAHAVFRQVPSYTFATQGRAPTDADAERLIKLLPSHLTEDDKHVLGIYQGAEIVGCAVVVRAYPKAHVAFIALLLIIEPLQSKSLGVEALRYIEAMAASWGCDRLGIVVDSANDRAHTFWVREGFIEQYRKQSLEFIGEIILMERGLGSNPSVEGRFAGALQPLVATPYVKR